MEIKARFDHFNFNVLDLEKSIHFYEQALGLKEVRRKTAADGSFILVYLGDGETGFTLELTWLRDRTEPRANTTSASALREIMTKSGNITGKWGASVMKTPTWDFISSVTRTGIGLKSFHSNSNFRQAQYIPVRRAGITQNHSTDLAG